MIKQIITNENLYLIENILSTFIPFYNEIIDDNISLKNSESVINSLNNKLTILYTLSQKKKKKNYFPTNNKSLKLEEKKFLYKTYLCSSDSNNNNYNNNIFIENEMRINSININFLRSILILIKEEFLDNNFIIIKKLSKVNNIIINESKNFNFKYLFIFFEYIIFYFCNNLEKITFSKLIFSKNDLVENMIKNGIYLHFIYRFKNLNKIISYNKIEFLNENSVFKILDEYIDKNGIDDININNIIINKINLIDCLIEKENLKNLVLKKISIDKIQMINQINFILKKNINLNEIIIDKFLSLNENTRKELINNLKKLSLINLQKIKISIFNSNLNDLEFLILLYFNQNSKLKFFSLHFQKLNLDEQILFNHLKLINNEKIEKISLKFDKIILNQNVNLFSILSKNLKNLTLGYCHQNIIKKLNFCIVNNIYLPNLENLKIIFLSINEEQIDENYYDLLSIIKNGKMIKNLILKNYYIKYKLIVDDELKNSIDQNINLRKLLIFYYGNNNFVTLKNKNLFYYEIPSYLIIQLLFIFKKHSSLKKLYNKKFILQNIFNFFRIKKEKEIKICYK